MTTLSLGDRFNFSVASIDAEKTFIGLGPGANLMKTFPSGVSPLLLTNQVGLKVMRQFKAVLIGKFSLCNRVELQGLALGPAFNSIGIILMSILLTLISVTLILQER